MSDLTKLIEAHNGDMALYYIWLKVNGAGSIEQAARDLCMPVNRVETAIEMLRLYGIGVTSQSTGSETSLPAVSSPTAAISDDVKSYTSAELKEVADTDSVFAAIRNEAASCLGKVLNKDDLSRLLDIYHNLGMDPQVLFVLLHYSKSISDKVRFSMYNVSKRAYAWNDMGIDSVEKAESYVESMRALLKRESKIKAILKIDYDITPKQREYVERWVKASYSDDMIRRAYEITLEKTNKLAWGYLDKVLQNMAEKVKEHGDTDPSANVGRPLPKSVRGNKS